MATIADKTLFVDPLYSDAATLSTSAVGSWVTSGDVALANILDREPHKIARSTSATSANTRFDLDFGTARSIDTFILGGIRNWTSSATITITAATSQANLTSSPTTVIASRSVWPSTGKPTESGWRNFVSYLKASSPQSFRWWRIAIVDTSNPDGYLELTRLIANAQFVPTYNVGWGLDTGYESFDLASLTPYAGNLTSERGQLRSFMMPFDHMTLADAELLNKLSFQMGTAKDLFCCIGPTEEADAHRYMMISRFASKPRMLRIPRVPGKFRTQINLVEISQ